MRQLCVAGLAGLLAACQSVTPEAPRPIASTFDPPEFVWYFLTREESPQAALLFAPNASDDIAIALSCNRRSDRVEIETYNPDTDGTRLYLASDNVARTVEARRLPEDEFYGDSVVSEAELPVSHPVIDAFRKSGSLAKGSPPVQLRIATPDELRKIEQFFAICQR